MRTEIADGSPGALIDRVWDQEGLDARKVIGTISVNRAGLDDGTYFGRITLHTNGGDVIMHIVMIAQAAPPTPANFNIFVRLVNIETGEIAGTSVVNPATGLEFAFDELPEGTYRLEAGTDDDGDGIICEAGELCGVYPIASSPVLIHVGADQERVGLDFTVTPSGALGG